MGFTGVSRRHAMHNLFVLYQFPGEPLDANAVISGMRNMGCTDCVGSNFVVK
jgi:hypothetical protein